MCVCVHVRTNDLSMCTDRHHTEKHKCVFVFSHVSPPLTEGRLLLSSQFVFVLSDGGFLPHNGDQPGPLQTVPSCPASDANLNGRRKPFFDKSNIKREGEAGGACIPNLFNGSVLSSNVGLQDTRGASIYISVKFLQWFCFMFARLND